MLWSFNWLAERKRCPRIEVGQRIGDKYRIESFIAEGGMSLVYAAVHTTLGQRVAIKFLKDELAEREDLVERFVNEARAFGRLSGDHVARVLDVGMMKGLPFMVLERLRGRDLHAIVAKSGAQAIESAVDWTLQACEALAEAHCAGIVHRDIKLENLFLAERPDGSSIIKLLDFGISKQAGLRVRHLTDPNVPMGSPYSMSPEQIRAPSTADMRTDIWGLGVVLYELLSGMNPFEGEGQSDIYVNVLRQTPRPLRRLRPEVPAGLEAVVMKCLHKQASERFRDVAELAEALVPFGPTVSRDSLRRTQCVFDIKSCGGESPKDSLGALDGLVLNAAPHSDPGSQAWHASFARRALLGASLALCGAGITLCVPQGRELAYSSTVAVSGWIGGQPPNDTPVEPDHATGVRLLTLERPLLKLATARSEREMPLLELSKPAPSAAMPAPRRINRPADRLAVSPSPDEPVAPPTEPVAAVDDGQSPDAELAETSEQEQQPSE